MGRYVVGQFCLHDLCLPSQSQRKSFLCTLSSSAHAAATALVYWTSLLKFWCSSVSEIHTVSIFKVKWLASDPCQYFCTDPWFRGKCFQKSWLRKGFGRGHMSKMPSSDGHPAWKVQVKGFVQRKRGGRNLCEKSRAKIKVKTRMSWAFVE